jgi:uncharacterized protein (DUF2252 family)
MRNIILNKIRLANANRIPALLALKYKMMRADKYSFFRATASLFFEDIPKNSFLFNAPIYIWKISGVTKDPMEDRILISMILMKPF